MGIVCTSFLWGYLSDSRGRRTVMLPAMVGSVFFSLASSFATTVWMLAGLRMLTGCLVSASSATVYAYLGEMHINSRRASAIAWGSVFISFSFIILPGLAWLIIPGEWSYSIGTVNIVPWRVFMWSWCVPGLIAAVFLAFLPESPRYILSAKGPQEALPVLAKMYKWNHGCSEHNYPLQKCRQNCGVPEEYNPLVTRVTAQQSLDPSQVERIANITHFQHRVDFAESLKNFEQLFKPPLLRCVFISHVSMFAVYMLSSGLYVWVPDILNDILQNTSNESTTICEIIADKINSTSTLNVATCKVNVNVAVFPISMGMGVIFAITFLAIGVFINKVGKKTLYWGIMVVCGMATIGSVFVRDNASATALLILALCSGCAASILASIAVDVFPTCLRAMAMCTMYMVGRAGAAFGSYILGALLDSHCQMSIVSFGVSSFVSAALMVYWPKPEKVRTEIEGRGLTY
ncbi:synaptic vesicle glycoprotein 2C-like [Hyposmocoma kahamanoa]|uniref:synaptic vesicle glycoprotein 2C-like n=1 Tax=Hyposmocoma kahamanoa TaxID=1477025 RepID=UPI000E6D5E6C|nr:synaptic vesicle glycoprotein 2C-like [Hyposmocoma kahamanoa]